MSDGEELRCVGRLFHRLAAKTGKARLPAVARLKDGTISWSEVDDLSLCRDFISQVSVFYLEYHPGNSFFPHAVKFFLEIVVL